jgi:hypothetical protein
MYIKEDWNFKFPFYRKLFPADKKNNDFANIAAVKIKLFKHF